MSDIIEGRKERMTKMRKWYAVVTRKDGTQFRIGAWSKERLQEDLNQIHRTKYANLEESNVEVYSVVVEV